MPNAINPSSSTLVDSVVLFPKGEQNDVEMALQTAPGPFPCPSGDIISPYGVFPVPKLGTKRAYRLKAVYYNENAGGDSHIEIQFKLFSGNDVTFKLPRVCSAQGASNFHYSDVYMPSVIDGSAAHVFASFVASQPFYDNHAGVYSLNLEAHDLNE